MQITFNTLPSAVADALLARSLEQGRSIHDVALEALQNGLNGTLEEIPLDFSDPDSNWIESAAFGQALHEFARLDSLPA